MILVFLGFNLVVLVLASLVHLYWAFGGRWPAKSETLLARAVVGSRGIEKMPPRNITLFVALCLFVAAIWPLVWLGVIVIPVPRIVAELGMVALIVIFVGRGVAGYTNGFRKKHSEEPFASNDRRYFSPLCLMIGSFYAALFFL